VRSGESSVETEGVALLEKYEYTAGSCGFAEDWPKARSVNGSLEEMEDPAASEVLKQRPCSGMRMTSK